MTNHRMSNASWMPLLAAIPIGEEVEVGRARVKRFSTGRYFVRVGIGGITIAKSIGRAAHYVGRINRDVDEWWK